MCQYLLTTNYIATCLQDMAECQVTYIYLNQLKFIRGWHFKYHGFIALQSCSAFHNAGSGVAIVSGSCNPVFLPPWMSGQALGATIAALASSWR